MGDEFVSRVEETWERVRTYAQIVELLTFNFGAHINKVRRKSVFWQASTPEPGKTLYKTIKLDFGVSAFIHSRSEHHRNPKFQYLRVDVFHFSTLYHVELISVVNENVPMAVEKATGFVQNYYLKNLPTFNTVKEEQTEMLVDAQPEAVPA